MADKEEGTVRRIRGDVVDLPKIERNAVHGAVSSISFKFRAAFVGEVTIMARGDVAAAYWSVTPGMKLAITGVETSEKTYVAEAIDIVPASPLA